MPAEWSVRRARPGDLDAIVALEQEAFQPWRQSSRPSLRRSLHSRHQSVWVVDAHAGGKGRPGPARDASAPRLAPRRAPRSAPRAAPSTLAGCLVLWHHPRTLRVYGIATRPDLQGQGVGRALMRHAEALARREGVARIVLEADAQDRHLLEWYEGQQFRRVHDLPDFYAPDKHAWRLQKDLGHG